MSTSTAPSGVEDSLGRELRPIMAAAARLGEKLARRNAERRQHEQRVAEHRRRELAERFEAQRAAARSHLAPVTETQFWERATPDEIGQRYVMAQQWAQHDDLAQTVQEKIEKEVEQRHGVPMSDYLERETTAGRAAREATVAEEFEAVGTRKWWNHVSMRRVAETYDAAAARLQNPDYAHPEAARHAVSTIEEGIPKHLKLNGIEGLHEVIAAASQQDRPQPHKDLNEAWWGGATGAEVAAEYARVAQSESSPQQRESLAAMRDQIRTRFEVSVPDDATELSGGQIVEIDAHGVQSAPVEVVGTEAGPAETTALAGAAAEADQTNAADAAHAATSSEQEWDSPQRREALLQRLRSTLEDTPAARDGIESRELTDLGHGVPPSQAATASGRSRGKAQDRDGQDRSLGADLGL